MQSAAVRVTFAVTCFLLTAVSFIFLLASIFVTIQAALPLFLLSSSHLVYQLIGGLFLLIILSVSCVGFCKIGIRLLHTRIRSLQPPNAKNGFLKLFCSILLVIVGLLFILIGIGLSYAVWLELGNSIASFTLVVLAGLFLVSVGVVIVRWGNNVKKSAFKKEEIELLGKKI
ncbi:hypothetical protein SAMN05660909_02392 [Chitinophaga terrae (ex Kim and Jung 2007)]|jgi:hypothetical protein|uniref:Uncharacterized protein n=1 Tax=Chitinophaga terrae (ex Kim and Jung 2007) TaxID=408074 RepID=A0A1H4C1G7_9BACT|nr:hypothetical protein [Chitinophaga terrae (ex Kim and Jung 2007)]MDQ0108551.1 small-conductance mechanosensitive channel [Chitinophaga terrae (ex Kim and Jung 2007)]GEP91979.1 hypothetical protein CTE07_36240 [Chitinophaga terrae (ex Kim and Jung 2007)]SEA54261.1 hypothetical protein SAMN05660909_02392 [Chitinophaga terrae (ex Kim and Jung 2007)]